MRFQLNYAVYADSALWTSSDAQVNEVGCFQVPTIRRIKFLQDYLLGKDLLLVAYSIVSQVWPPALHQFKGDNADSEEV